MRIWLAVLMLVALTACGRPRWDKVPELSPADQPQRGGELNVGSIAIALSALSWDPADWTWKAGHDTGAVREQLFVANLDMAQSRGGPYDFTAEAFVPDDAVIGELAERWEWETPLTLVVHLRRGVMWPDKPGVMKSRELDAEDVIFTMNYLASSPKAIKDYFDYVDRLEARDSHTLVIHFSKYSAEWMYRFGYGYYSGIIPREAGAVDQRDWKNLTGAGPFKLDRYLSGSVQSYARNPDYWGVATIGGTDQTLPLIDRITYRIIKDEATWISAIRTGKLDILEITRWTMAKHLMETTPELQWRRWLFTAGTVVAMRTDQKPFDDVRVRRALNMAIDKKEMVRVLSEGQAELMAFPQHPSFGRYFQPLDEMPASVRELFELDVARAKQLLAEAGYPDGFETKIQVSSANASHMDLAPLLVDYWSRIGVRATIEPLEYGAHLSSMTTRNHGPLYLYDTGHVNPTTALRKNFVTGQLWNVAMYSNPDFDREVERIMQTRDEQERIGLVRALTIRGLEEAPYVWLPTNYVYTFWWPWVRNYGGELRAGAYRPGPIYARIWIDHDLKKRMGFE